jgi:hypothetical protein
MQPRTCILAAFTLSTTIFVGAAAMAADLPREGTWNTKYSAFGTAKSSTAGKDWTAGVSDETGVTVGDGLLDHFTWHCWGLSDTVKGTSQFHGYCTGTDPTGDQVAGNYASDGRYAADSKHINGTFTFTAGTGKYAGISGGGSFVTDSSSFRAPTEGTYFSHNTNRGNYKLP